LSQMKSGSGIGKKEEVQRGTSGSRLKGKKSLKRGQVVIDLWGICESTQRYP